MEGFIIDNVRRAPSLPIIGFKGFSVEFDGGIGVKVVDQRGTNQAGVLVTASNPTSGIPKSGVTDENGNAVIELDASNPNTITYTKNTDTKTFSYTGGNSISLVLEEFYFPIN